MHFHGLLFFLLGYHMLRLAFLVFLNDKKEKGPATPNDGGRGLLLAHLLYSRNLKSVRDMEKSRPRLRRGRRQRSLVWVSLAGMAVSQCDHVC